MKTKILTLLSVLFLSLSVFAKDEPLPESLPLTTATLEAYAYTLVDNIDMGLYAETAENYGVNVTVAYPYKDADPEHMSLVASMQKLRVNADPKDIFQTYVGYQGKVGHYSYNVFYGGRSFELFLTKGGWEIPESAYGVKMRVTSWVPVKMSGIARAYMDITDQDGRYIDHYNFDNDDRVDREEEILFLGPEHMDQNGKLTIIKKDGTKAVYDMPTGSRRPFEDVEISGIRPSSDGVRSIKKDSATILYQGGDKLLRAPYTQRMVVDVVIPEKGTPPIGVYAIDTEVLAEDAFAPWVPLVSEKGSRTFVSTPGQVLFIRFEYEPNPREIEGDYETSNGGSGKGE